MSAVRSVFLPDLGRELSPAEALRHRSEILEPGELDLALLLHYAPELARPAVCGYPGKVTDGASWADCPACLAWVATTAGAKL